MHRMRTIGNNCEMAFRDALPEEFDLRPIIGSIPIPPEHQSFNRNIPQFRLT